MLSMRSAGWCFPQIQIKQFPRLERFDVEFDLLDCFLPEFPPPIFLDHASRTRRRLPRRGSTCRDFDRLFRGLVTPVQLDGLRMLVTQFPQEEFNATHDRKSMKPSLGVTCLDCHVNFSHDRAISPESRYPSSEGSTQIRYCSLRGLFNQQIHGSERSLRSVEDFTEFEQRVR